MYMRNQVLKHIGCICVALSLGLALFNVYDTFRARKSEEDILAAYNLKNDLDPDIWIDPDMDMPEVDVDGISCIGTLEIPRLGLNLCVTSTCSDENMKQLPCRYYGSIYKSNMVIIAHNYWFHFGRLNTLKSGDEVIFTDASGNCFKYVVDAMDVVSPESVAEVTNGKWPLTLVTCTLDSQNRIVVRCK